MVMAEAQASGLPILASDSIPTESVIVPEIIRFLPLSAGPAHWATEAMRFIDQDRPDVEKCNQAVQNSAFSIQASALRLLRIYGGGQPDFEWDKPALAPQALSGLP